jgi:hypothetical protein
MITARSRILGYWDDSGLISRRVACDPQYVFAFGEIHCVPPHRNYRIHYACPQDACVDR